MYLILLIWSLHHLIFFFSEDLKSTKFIEDSIRELLKARKILCGSYVYGYYLENNGQSRSIFEFMQVTYNFYFISVNF